MVSISLELFLFHGLSFIIILYVQEICGINVCYKVLILFRWFVAYN